MHEVIYHKQFLLTLKKNIFLYIGFASLTIISSYNAPLTFDVPFPGILIFIFCILLHCLTNNFILVKLSIISFLLCLRLFLFLINAIILDIDLETICEQIATTLISVLIFESFRNISKDNTNVIKYVLVIVSLLTSAQLIIGFSGNLFEDKNDIVAGIGNSNYAATFLLLSITFMMFIKTKWYEKAVILIDIVALLLTQSFGAYLALGVVLIIFFIKKMNWRKATSWLILFGIIVIAFLCFKILINTELGTSVYNKIYDKISYLLIGDLNSFGSSRLELYRFSWDNITKHFLFGSINNFNHDLSLNYKFQDFRTHNFVLESLLLYGLAGTILNILIFICLIKDIKANKGKNETFAFKVTLIAILMHGLLEPNLFTMHFEPFLWLILGGLVSLVKCNSMSVNKLITKI